MFYFKVANKVLLRLAAGMLSTVHVVSPHSMRRCVMNVQKCIDLKCSYLHLTCYGNALFVDFFILFARTFHRQTFVLIALLKRRSLSRILINRAKIDVAERRALNGEDSRLLYQRIHSNGVRLSHFEWIRVELCEKWTSQWFSTWTYEHEQFLYKNIHLFVIVSHHNNPLVPPCKRGRGRLICLSIPGSVRIYTSVCTSEIRACNNHVAA